MSWPPGDDIERHLRNATEALAEAYGGQAVISIMVASDRERPDWFVHLRDGAVVETGHDYLDAITRAKATLAKLGTGSKELRRQALALIDQADELDRKAAHD